MEDHNSYIKTAGSTKGHWVILHGNSHPLKVTVSEFYEIWYTRCAMRETEKSRI
jgi:hypothetical protein